jgi:hypothetical protein
MSVLLPCGSVSGTTKKYAPRSKEEVDVLSLLVASEMKANDWKKNELICFSVDGIDPSPKLVKSLRQRDLNVRSSAEWTKKFNCGFELQLEFTQFDLSLSIRVHSKVLDLREINKGEGHIAVLMQDGEYSIQKVDGEWSISQYVKTSYGRLSAANWRRRSQPICSSSEWHKVDAGPFSILAPSGWEFHQLTGVDSYVGEFVGDSVALTFDFGRYSSSLNDTKRPAYVIAKTSIGGYRAKVVSPRTPGKGITGVYFRNVSGGAALCLWGKDLSAAHQELVLQIFETIRFGGAVPRYVIPPPPPPDQTQNTSHMPG